MGLKILHTVQYYHPAVGGSEEVVRQISERLALRGHDVTVATSIDQNRTCGRFNGVDVVGFDISGNQVKGIKGSDVRRYQEFVIDNQFDVIMNYAAQTWATDLLFDGLDRTPAVKILAPCGFSGLRTMKARIFYWNYFRKLPKAMRRYDLLIYHSAGYLDKQFGDRHGINNYRIIPNAADLAEFNRVQHSFRLKYGIETPYMLLNVSNHYKLKGHSLVIDAFEALGRDDVTLVILGHGAKSMSSCVDQCERAARRNPRIKVLEVPRQDVIAAFKGADVFVFGSRIECFPLVVLEAMSAGLPFVSTDCGNVAELPGGVVVSSAPEMARTVDSFLRNEETVQRLRRQGLESVRERFNWDVVVTQYEEAYIDTFQAKVGARPL